jgi:hypothetical protein
MSQVDASGYMKVYVGGDVVRRRAEVRVVACDLSGNPLAIEMRPVLNRGEILCEHIGMIPSILMSEGIGGA